MTKANIKQAISCAKNEFSIWLIDARMLLLSVLLIFDYSFAIKPLQLNSEIMGKPLNILEPFIALANNGLLLLFLPLLFLTLIADYPRADANNIFNIVRIGRVNWLIGQMIKLFFMAASYIIFVIIGTIAPMIGNGRLTNHWSEVVTKFTLFHPEESQNPGVRLLPENLYNQLSVYQAAILSYTFLFMYLLIIGLILLFFSLIRKKTAGFIVCGALISVGTVLCSIKSKMMWTMPMAHSIIWLHYTKYFKQPVVSLHISAIYLITVIVLLIISCFAVIRRFSFENLI